MKKKTKQILAGILAGVLLSTGTTGCEKEKKDKQYSIEEILQELNFDETKLDELLSSDMLSEYKELIKYLEYSEIIHIYLIKTGLAAKESKCDEACDLDGLYYGYLGEGKENTIKSAEQLEEIISKINKTHLDEETLIDALIYCNQEIRARDSVIYTIRKAVVEAALEDSGYSMTTKGDPFRYLSQQDYADMVTGLYDSPVDVFIGENNLNEDSKIDMSTLYYLGWERDEYMPSCQCQMTEENYSPDKINQLQDEIAKTNDYVYKLYYRKMR